MLRTLTIPTVQNAGQAANAWLIVITGFLPVGSIVLHCLGILPLGRALGLILLPLMLVLLSAFFYNKKLGKLALEGWLFGLLAVFIYDLSRIPFMLYGWADFIPKVGGWINGSNEPNAWLGYLWRYVGNGGGMGMAYWVCFSLFRWRKRILGLSIGYGLFIYSCLIATLLLFPEAQEMMFRLAPLSLTGSFIGHVVYGAVLGLCYRNSLRKNSGNSLKPF